MVNPCRGSGLITRRHKVVSDLADGAGKSTRFHISRIFNAEDKTLALSTAIGSWKRNHGRRLRGTDSWDGRIVHTGYGRKQPHEVALFCTSFYGILVLIHSISSSPPLFPILARLHTTTS